MIFQRGEESRSPILNIHTYIEYIEMAKDTIKTIGITENSKIKIKKLAAKYKYADVTILEYLLNGKINLEEFINI
jgi:thymidylate synthase